MARPELGELDVSSASPGVEPVPGTRHVVRIGDVVVGLLPPADGSGALRARAIESSSRRLFAESVVVAAEPDGATDHEVQVGAGDLTVVVCTRDRPELLDGCLAALRAQREAPAAILVVDNAPRDDRTRDVAHAHGVDYAVESRPGLDHARNRGLATTATSIVAFTDDDARPDPGWVAAVAVGFRTPEVGCVTGVVLPAELETEAQELFEDVYGGMAKGYELRLFGAPGQPRGLRPEAMGTGCNMAFRRDALLALGGFDPALDVGTPTGGGGDLDAFVRVIDAGWAIEYRPDAVVRHLHRRTEDALERQLFDNGRAYSAVLYAAFLRARGVGRIRPVVRYGQWLGGWHGRRLMRRALGREQLPFRYLAAELKGAPLGPFLYLRSRRAVASSEDAP